MQRRDIETEDKGGEGGGMEGRGTASGKHRNISTAHADCRLQTAPLQSVGGLQQMHRGGSRTAASSPSPSRSCSCSCSCSYSCSATLPRFHTGTLPQMSAGFLVPPLPLPLLPHVQLQHTRCQHAPQTLQRSSDWPSMPSQDHSSSMRLLVRRSANNQRGGLAIRKRLASKLLGPCHVLLLQ